MKKLILSSLLVFSSVIMAMAAGHTVTITGININCNGGCDGQAIATVSGGVGPFLYDWSPGTPVGDGTNTISGLCPGTYSVTVTDNSDMSTATASVVISEPTLLTTSISGGGVTICSGSCTTLTATATGGTPPYTFTWSPSGTMSPTYVVCPPTGATYTVVVTDMNGCTNTSITSIAATVVPVTVNSPTICVGMIATLTGGGASTYVWSTGATSSVITVNPVITTSYTVTGTSAGCTATAVSTVIVNPIPVVTVNSPTICSGGIATLTGGGATTYIWSTGSASAFISVSPASTTSYTVTGNSLGCTNSAVSTVTVNPPITFPTPAPTTICYGDSTTIVPSPSGGSPPFTYVWTPGGTTTTLTVSPSLSTSYTITLTDAAGCSAPLVVATVFVDGPIISNITSTNTTGCVICDGTTSVAPIGGSGPYVYSWPSGTSTLSTVTGLCAGTYSVTITDAAGCTITDSTNIFANNDIVSNFTMVPDSTNPYNFFAFNSSTGSGASYLWNFGDGAVSPAASPSHTYSATGTMTVCLTASSFLCGADTLCKPVTVTGTPLSCLALFNIADDTLNPDPNAHYVYNLSFGSTLTYLWDFGDGTTSTSATPSHVYAGTGPYLLCLGVDNGAGCTDMFCDSLISADSLNRSSGIMQLTVYDVPPFQTSTAGIINQLNATSVSISPNPFNDVTVFEIKSNKSDIYSFELTDVLGKKVKSINGITTKQFEISRNGLENGIYFYKIYSSESIIGVGKVVIE
ncbi:hypothetical protein BH10BAC1_BH10BAC1_01610 [soil metagenome]